MHIAQQLQAQNRAEFLLYMWQVEDLLRANDCSIEKISKNYLSQFQLSPQQAEATHEWYANLCEMMRSEGKEEKGHLQINQNVISGLVDLHHELMESERHSFYKQMYHQILPHIVALRSKRPAITQETHSMVYQELETCFEFLYGLMLLRLKKQNISPQTTAAAKEVSAYLGQLADYWKAQKQGELEL